MNRKYVVLTKKKIIYIYIYIYDERIGIHSSHESETQTGVVLTTNQGKQKIDSEDLNYRPGLVYQRLQNKKYGKLQKKKKKNNKTNIHGKFQFNSLTAMSDRLLTSRYVKISLERTAFLGKSKSKADVKRWEAELIVENQIRSLTFF